MYIMWIISSIHFFLFWFFFENSSLLILVVILFVVIFEISFLALRIQFVVPY